MMAAMDGDASSATDQRPHRMRVHPMLVPVPIGCWVAALVFDVASHLVAGPGFLTRGATWLLTIGLVAAIVAGLAGLVDAIPIPPGSAANRVTVIHLSVATLTVLVQAVNLVLRLGMPTGQPVPWPDLGLSVLGFAALVVTGWYGGLVVHRHGTWVPAPTRAAPADEA
jgi:uncharacterized membrane protein